MERSPGRRRFLKSVTALSAIGLPVTSVAADAHSQLPDHAAHAKHGAQTATLLQAYSYFTQPEATFVEAAVSRLIPADDLGPGAKEAGVAYFIDQQLDGAWGAHARTYRLGPWTENKLSMCVAGSDAPDKYGRHTARRPAPGQFEGLRHRVASLIDTVPWYRAAPVEWAKHRGPAVPFHPL